MGPMNDTINRREALWRFGGGLGGVALASLMAEGSPHHRPRAKRVVQLFMSGAASHCDTFDYKPRLASDHGRPWDPGERVELFQSSPGTTMRSPWPWRQYGQCGKWVNDCVAPLGGVVDELAFVHDLTSRSNVHGPATFLQSTGFVLPGFPGVGAWVSYGLGSEADDLPTFVVLPDPRGFPPNGPKNWSAGFLPAAHQGTMIRPHAEQPIRDLFPPREQANRPESESDVRSALHRLNRIHAQDRPEDSRLDARIRSYELAARMQLSAPDVLDLSRETDATLRMYGIDSLDIDIKAGIDEQHEAQYFGLNCLIARRLLERGVRFVQIWSGADNGHPRRNWDSHEDLQRDHWPLGRGMAIGAAALIRDLKRRGLLEDTIILWTTEFGRMPCSQGSKGRDHNPFAFTNWLAGGGIKGGTSVGESDEWGFKPAESDRAHTGYDIHATLLHLLGLDHEQLSVRHDGIDRRLTDVHGHVIREILA